MRSGGVNTTDSPLGTKLKLPSSRIISSAYHLAAIDQTSDHHHTVKPSWFGLINASVMSYHITERPLRCDRVKQLLNNGHLHVHGSTAEGMHGIRTAAVVFLTMRALMHTWRPFRTQPGSLLRSKREARGGPVCPSGAAALAPFTRPPSSQHPHHSHSLPFQGHAHTCGPHHAAIQPLADRKHTKVPAPTG